MSEWTVIVQARVGAGLEPVVAWWTRRERLDEQRAHFEALAGGDFAYHETIDSGTRIIDTAWTTPRGLQISLRLVGRAGDVVERDEDGAAVLRHETSQSRRWPDGREDRSRSDVVVVLSRVSDDATRVRLTATRSKEGGPWWDRFLAAPQDRRHRRRHLEELAERCERDLGVV